MQSLAERVALVTWGVVLFFFFGGGRVLWVWSCFFEDWEVVFFCLFVFFLFKFFFCVWWVWKGLCLGRLGSFFSF